MEKAKVNDSLEITKPVNEDSEQPVFLTPIVLMSFFLYNNY